MKKKSVFALIISIFMFLGYLFYSNRNDTIKIFITFHKPFQLPTKGDILIPIHVGRDVEDVASFDGHLSQDDISWLHDNMIGDNLGENISKKNRMFDVLTAYYYVWKNYSKFGSPDYIGFMAHRKILITNPNEYRNFNRSAPNYGYTKKDYFLC